MRQAAQRLLGMSPSGQPPAFYAPTHNPALTLAHLQVQDTILVEAIASWDLHHEVNSEVGSLLLLELLSPLAASPGLPLILIRCMSWSWKGRLDSEGVSKARGSTLFCSTS